MGKPKLHGSSSIKMLINMNGLSSIGGKGGEYTGIAIWSRKKCGQNFIDAINDGTVTYDVLDKYVEANPAGFYSTASQLWFLVLILINLLPDLPGT